MSRLKRRYTGRGILLADLTPLIDISLVLVAFLLLTSNDFLLQSLPVVLPQSAHGEPQLNSQRLQTLFVLADGQLRLDDDIVNLDRISQHIESGDRVRIEADANCRHGQLIDILDALVGIGVEEIVYGTKQKVTDGVEDW